MPQSIAGFLGRQGRTFDGRRHQEREVRDREITPLGLPKRVKWLKPPLLRTQMSRRARITTSVTHGLAEKHMRLVVLTRNQEECSAWSSKPALVPTHRAHKKRFTPNFLGKYTNAAAHTFFSTDDVPSDRHCVQRPAKGGHAISGDPNQYQPRFFSTTHHHAIILLLCGHLNSQRPTPLWPASLVCIEND